MFSGICKWRGAGLPSLVAEARGWEANARKAAWEQEPRTREPAAFLPNGGLREEPPGWGAKLPEAGRLAPESLSSQHPSCPWPLRGLRFPAYFVSSTSPQLSLRFFSSFAELGFRWPVVSLVSGVFPVWGRPDGQIEVRAFRKYLRRSIPEIVARLYCPKSLLEPPLDRVLGRQRLGALEKPEENFRRVPGSGSFAGLDWGAGVA